MLHFFSRIVVACVLLAAPLMVFAEGFGINATRLIYPQGANSISVTLRNTTTHQPYLTQVAMSKEQNSLVAAPFVVSPPLFRLEPKSTNQVRIMLTREALPADRESVFYFHATAIPASQTRNDSQADDKIKGITRFAVGNTIKVFYRPSGLSGTSVEAQKNLRFTRQGNTLVVTNPSAYYVSLAGLKVGSEILSLATPQALMLAPFSSHTYTGSTINSPVVWQTINDMGGVDSHVASLS